VQKLPWKIMNKGPIGSIFSVTISLEKELKRILLWGIYSPDVVARLKHNGGSTEEYHLFFSFH